MTPHPRAELRPGRLLQVLVGGGVDFVVIGGVAALVHGSGYPTSDVDIAYSRSKENVAALAAALSGLDPRIRGIEPAATVDEQLIWNSTLLLLETSLGDLDLIGEARGAPPYEQLRAGAQTVAIEGIPVLAASLDHLIAMKRTTGRPKDRLVLDELTALSDEAQKDS